MNVILVVVGSRAAFYSLVSRILLKKRKLLIKFLSLLNQLLLVVEVAVVNDRG